MVWQIGGQVAEDTARSTASIAINRAREDLNHALPSLDLSTIQFSTYLAERAEGTSSGRRPDRPTTFVDGNVITVWPTKLALVPMLSDMIQEDLKPPADHPPFQGQENWPTASVAIPPWEMESSWTNAH
tara:strand:+ start:9215 stop:9601 length:387 start_codon:yes stop_codon:yes gene_type:complete